MTPCHDAQVVGHYTVSNPLRLTILAAKTEDYTIAQQHLQSNIFQGRPDGTVYGMIRIYN